MIRGEEMKNLKTVVMPDGGQFDEQDWFVYSEEYIKRPVVVRAVQLQCPVKIQTLEGEMIGNVGDYLICGVQGEFYPCKPEIFKKTYQKKEPTE